MEIASYKISGILETAGVSKGVQKFGDEMTRVSKFVAKTKTDMKGLYDLAPIRKTNYTAFEQEVRNAQAAQIRAMRNTANAEKVQAEVQRRMFGGPAAAAAAEEAGQQVGDKVSKGILSELNNSLGKRSAFGKTLKLLAGGGVIGGLGLAVGQFDELTKKAEDFALALDKGPDATREAAANLLRAVPIAGKLGEALDRVWDIATGTAVEIARIEQSTKNIEAATGFRERTVKGISDARDDAEKFAKEQRNVRELIGVSGASGEAIRVRQKSEADIDAAKEKLKADIDKARTDASATIESIRKTIPATPEKPGLGSIILKGSAYANSEYEYELSQTMARRKSAEEQIAQIQRDLAKRIAEETAAYDRKVSESKKTLIAEDVQIARGAWGALSEFAGKAFETVSKGFSEKLKDDGEKIKKAAEEAKKIDDHLNERAKDIIDSSKNKIEKAADRLKEIEALVSAGKLTADQADKAINSVGVEFASRQQFSVPSGDRVHGFGVSSDFFRNPQNTQVEKMLDETRKHTKETAEALKKVQSVGVFKLG